MLMIRDAETAVMLSVVEKDQDAETVIAMLCQALSQAVHAKFISQYY